MNEQNDTNQLRELERDELAVVAGGADRVEVTMAEWERIVVDMARKAGYNMNS